MGQDAGAGRVARKKGPTREINRGWFLLWFPDHRLDFDRVGRVLPNFEGQIEESKFIICEYSHVLLELSSFSLRQSKCEIFRSQLRYKRGERAWPGRRHSL